MGCDFLIKNAVSDIPMNVMKTIKKEAFEKYLIYFKLELEKYLIYFRLRKFFIN